MWLFNEDGSSELALELIQAIFCYVSIEDLARLALVCQWFNFYSKDNVQWQLRLGDYDPEAYQYLVTRKAVDYKAELRKLALFRFFPIPMNGDPKETGKRASQRADDLPLENLSYLASLGGRIGAAEFRGLTYPKLGRVSVGVFHSAHLSEISSVKHGECLASTVELLQDCIHRLRMDLHSAASLCGVTLVGRDVHTVNLGDCFAIAVVLNEDNKLSRFLILNSFRHRAAEESEKKRITKAGGYVSGTGWIQNSRGDSCNLSRGLGGTSFKGFSHEPNTYSHHIDVNENNKAFVILGSRRLMGENALTEKRITALFEEHHGKSPRQIAAILASEVIAENSNASASILVSTLDTSARRAKHMVVFEALTDIEVAKTASQLFRPVLEIKLQCAILCNYFGQEIIVELTQKVDFACSYLYTIFDERKGRRLRNTIPTFLHQAYSNYAQLIGDLVDALAQQDASKVEDCFARVDTYSDILLLPTRLEYLQMTYIPRDCVFPGGRSYLRHPPNFINALKESVLEVNKENILRIHTKLDSIVKDLNFLYQAAGVVLSIREKYDSFMPFEFKRGEDYNSSQKVWIHKLKSAVDFIFTNYQKLKTSVLVEMLLETLKSKDQMLNDTPIIGFALQFFSGDDRLKWCLAKAISELEEIQVNLSLHESTIEIEELPCSDPSPALG